MKKKKSNFFAEFKTFITRGNVMDMAVGVIVGGAFTAIVNALSNNILKPIINWFLALILGKNSLSEVFTYLTKVYKEEAILDAAGNATGEVRKVVDLSQSIYIDWGSFINAIINFILIAFVLFCIVKALNKLNEMHIETKNEVKMRKIAVAKYRELGLTGKEAVAKYENDLAKAADEKAALEKIAEEEKIKAEEAKTMANTHLLEEIRDLLKKDDENKHDKNN